MPLDPMVNKLRTKFSNTVEDVRQLKDAATKANGPLPMVVPHPGHIPPTGHFQLVLVAMEELGRMWDKQIQDETGGNG
jgi:hypothetical protein